MKLRLTIPLLITSSLLILFIIGSSSCSQKHYRTSKKVSYNRSSRIKVYKKPTSNRSFKHQAAVQKKYRIKK